MGRGSPAVLAVRPMIGTRAPATVRSAMAVSVSVMAVLVFPVATLVVRARGRRIATMAGASGVGPVVTTVATGRRAVAGRFRRRRRSLPHGLCGRRQCEGDHDRDGQGRERGLGGTWGWDVHGVSPRVGLRRFGADLTFGDGGGRQEAIT